MQIVSPAEVEGRFIEFAEGDVSEMRGGGLEPGIPRENVEELVTTVGIYGDLRTRNAPPWGTLRHRS